MKPDEARQLKQSYPQADWNETHISYVLMTENRAYKIMKTIKLDFLDFSTLDQRRHNCEEELRLNQRLAPDMYQAVVPVVRQDGQLKLDEDGEVLDYAVKMKRMDEQRLMSELLEKGKVLEQQIRQLAEVIAEFHLQAPVADRETSTEEFAHNFNELEDQTDWIKTHVGDDYAGIVRQAVAISDQFLQENSNLLEQRQKAGLVRDVHGDLHSHNVFLYDKPVIFDGISFNDAFRKIDLLNEVAFMGMDLEAQGAIAFSNLFYQEYITQMSKRGIEHVEHQRLYTYFKLYRANVRVKVSAIDAQEREENPDVTKIEPYLRLMKKYTEGLE